MARRILAALVAVVAVLTLTPDRLSGEPTTTRPTAAPAPNMMVPNPHAVYPRRPGAKYNDFEVPPDGSAPLIATVSIARSAIEPRRSLPRGWQPALENDARARRITDGYTPVSTDTRGDVLHVVVHEKNAVGPVPLLCSATAVSDGAVLLPYTEGTQHPVVLPKPTPGSTTAGARKPAAFDVDLYLPLGARRGRLYLGCQLQPFLGLAGGPLPRAVWAIDV